MQILLADDHPEVVSALRLAIERVPGMQVSAVAPNFLALLEQAGRSCPDMILLDAELAGLPTGKSTDRRSAWRSLHQVADALRALCPQAGLLAMSVHPEAEVEALDAGPDGCLSKTDPPEVLLSRLQEFQRERQTHVSKSR